MKSSPFSLFVVLFAFAIGATPARAQTGAASMTGLITDQSGAAVPGATVTATNQATNVDYTAVTNEAGNYTITSVPVGTYIIKAELASFKTATTKPITVEAKQILRFDFKLEVGGLEQNVEVTGESPVLQTESATVGEVISGDDAVVVAAQRPQHRPALAAAARSGDAESEHVHAIRNTGSGGRPYVNGNREQTNNYTIDGVDMNESIDNLVAYQPSPDALAEISVETNNYAADSGNVAGAVISNVIKSGRTSITATPSSSIATAAWTRTVGRTTARTPPSPIGGRTSSAARWAGR